MRGIELARDGAARPDRAAGRCAPLVRTRPVARRRLLPRWLPRARRRHAPAADRRQRAAPKLPAAVTTAAKPPPRFPTAPSKMIDIAQVQGQVHAQSVQKVGELAEQQPERDRFHRPLAG